MAGGFDDVYGFPGYSSGTYGQRDDELSKWLSQMQQGGLFGLGDTATGGLLSFGGSALEGIARMIGGPTAAQKAARKTYGLAQNRLGQNVLDPNQYMADYMRTRGPANERTAERLNQRFGLDSGVAQSQLAYDMEAPLAQFLLQTKSMNDQLKSRNDNALLALMAQLSPAM